MSIEKIKEYNREVNDFKNDNVQWSEWMLLCSIANYLIEQEEQKEPVPENAKAIINLVKLGDEAIKEHDVKLFDFDKIDFSDFRFKGNDPVVDANQEKTVTKFKTYSEEDIKAGKVPLMKFEPVVEVGQIWRGERLYEIKSVKGARANVINENDEEGSLIISNILKYSRLVTMDNIKKGEWVLNTDSNRKYKVEGIQGNNSGYIVHKHHTKDNQLVNSKMWYKPCLPPIKEKETIEPPTVSEYNPDVGLTEDYVKDSMELTGKINEYCEEKLKLNDDGFTDNTEKFKNGGAFFNKKGKYFNFDEMLEHSLSIFSQEDLDKAVKEAEDRCMAEGFRQGYEEAVNPKLLGSEKTLFTKEEVDEAREEVYNKAEALYKKQLDELVEASIKQIKEAVERTIKIYKKSPSLEEIRLLVKLF